MSRQRSHRRLTSNWRIVGYGVVLLTAMLAVSSATVAASMLGQVPGTSAAAAASRGESLYLTSCAGCHGPQGAGTANGPDITAAGAALADFELRTGRMPLGDQGPPARRGTPRFNDADTRALVAYVASLGQGPAIPDVVVSGADLRAGRGLFVENCAACHGPAGEGGAVGRGFVAPSLAAADPTTVGEAVLTGPGPMPRFSFSPAEVNDLAAYVQFLRDPPHPGGSTAAATGPVAEGLVAGLALLALLLVARWVAARREQPQ